VQFSVRTCTWYQLTSDQGKDRQDRQASAADLIEIERAVAAAEGVHLLAAVDVARHDSLDSSACLTVRRLHDCSEANGKIGIGAARGLKFFNDEDISEGGFGVKGKDWGKEGGRGAEREEEGGRYIGREKGRGEQERMGVICLMVPLYRDGRHPWGAILDSVETFFRDIVSLAVYWLWFLRYEAEPALTGFESISTGPSWRNQLTVLAIKCSRTPPAIC
jgi:hypothetical protein